MTSPTQSNIFLFLSPQPYNEPRKHLNIFSFLSPRPPPSVRSPSSFPFFSIYDQYLRFLLVLKKMECLERRQPDTLPYSEIHTLRENLLESPPQVAFFGEFSAGNGLFIAALGFILSYAMLANDILDLKGYSVKTNSTLSMQLC